jgi:hypothetical protein
MKVNDGWTLTLFPSLPLALLAVAQTNSPPCLMLVEEDSILNGHVSALRLPQQGYSIRTFDEQAGLDLTGRTQLTPTGRLAVHRDLGVLKWRVSEKCTSRYTEKVWNHVENITEQELFEFPSQVSARPNSATLRLPGCPGGVALLMEQENQIQMPDIIEGLGLHYQDGLSL